MKRIIVCLICLSSFSCNSYKQKSVDLNSLDTVKQYLSGTWEFQNEQGKKFWNIYSFKKVDIFFDSKYTGTLDFAVNKAGDNYTVSSEGAVFNLRKVDSLVVMQLLHENEKVEEKIIEFLSKDELIVDGKSFKRAE